MRLEADEEEMYTSILVICQEFLKKILIYFSGKRVTLIDLRRKIQRRTSVLVDI